MEWNQEKKKGKKLKIARIPKTEEMLYLTVWPEGI